MADYMANCLNIEPKVIKVIFYGGEMITVKTNGSWQEIKDLYPVGEIHKFGDKYG
jgi:hypothetical protein